MRYNRNTAGQSRSFGSTLLAVAWSFIGLRRRKDFEQDVGGLNPVLVLAAALVGVAILVLCLLMLVQLAVR